MAPKKKLTAGRVVVMGSYWTLLVWSFGSIFGSMFASLYSDVPPAGPALNDAWCLGTLTHLKADLDDRTMQRLADRDLAAHGDAREKPWEDRLQYAQTHCTNDARLQQAFVSLADMRTAYNGLVEGVSDAQGTQAAAIDATVHALTHN